MQELLLKETHFLTLCSLRSGIPISKDIQVSVLYLSTESRPSAHLVLDVYHYIQSFPQFSRTERQASQFPVFIETVEKRKDSLLLINETKHAIREVKYQKWTFLDQEKTQAFYVTSAIVKEGGTGFSVEYVE